MGRSTQRWARLTQRAWSVALGVGILAACADLPAPPREPWFGGYAQVTAFPEYEFGREAPAGSRVVLAFVVGAPEDPCVPSWEGQLGLEDAAAEVHLERQILAVREKGGDVAISFGGAAGHELATGCWDTERLYDAYRSVIDRYQVNVVDFDIEMDDLEDDRARTRRAEVVARLQEDHTGDRPLEVWLTLPASVQGLDRDGEEEVARMVEADVDLAGVNLMTMAFGAGKAPDQNLQEAAEAAVLAAHGQVATIYRRAGVELSEAESWSRLGLTPMIGQNDVPGEVLDRRAAAGLNEFVRDRGLGRLSFWSLNRDRPCGPAQKNPQEASYLCSGTGEPPGEFTRVLGEGLRP